MRDEAAKATHRTVTLEQFIELSVSAGESEEDAKRTAKIAMALGGSTLVGGEMLSIAK